MRLGAGLEAGQPNVRLERGGGRYRPTVRGAHAVGGCGRGTRIVEQHGMHLDHVQRRTGGVLEVLLEDRQVDAAVDDQLGLLEYFAAGGLDRLLAGLDASAREGPATVPSRVRSTRGLPDCEERRVRCAWPPSSAP